MNEHELERAFNLVVSKFFADLRAKERGGFPLLWAEVGGSDKIS